MNFKYIISSAMAAIGAHKMRSFLTILGILIGIASIIAIMSIGQGATSLIVAEIDQVGASTVVVVPSTGGDGLDLMDFYYADPLTSRDLDALRRPANAPHIEAIMPGVLVPGYVRYQNETYRRAMILGAEAEFFGATFNVRPIVGADFTEVNIRARDQVVVIGHRVKEELFGSQPAVGEHISIGDHRFRVMGVYPPIGQRGFFNIDDLVIMPYSAAQTYVLGHDEFDRFIIRIDNPVNIDRSLVDITTTLRATRNIGPGEEDNFTTMTQQNLLSQINNIMSILTYFLIFVVSIALLVGGIGIMNIMLVSVTERTKEIGLRKALGATKRDILNQFLWEAILLTVGGGILGVMVGGLISFTVSYALSQALNMAWPFVFPISAVVLGVGMSATVGVIFGLYPAKQAADQDPIEALLYE